VKKLSSIKARSEALDKLARGEGMTLDEQRAWVLEAANLNDRMMWLKRQVLDLKSELETERRRLDALIKAVKARQV
jgi:cell division protein ZapA (FtsZ GTPase activity inhibitor)